MQYMSTPDSESEQPKTVYINLINHLEEKILQWLGKGDVFRVDLEIAEEDGVRKPLTVYVYALNINQAIEKARSATRYTSFQINTESPSLGLLMPARRMSAEDTNKGTKGYINTKIKQIRETASTTLMPSGVPKPFSLTSSHIRSMLNSKEFQVVSEDEMTIDFIQKYANRCIVISTIWICLLLTGFAIFLSGFHPSHTERAIFGLINPFSAFGFMAITVGGLGLAHSILARRNATSWLEQNKEI